MRKHPGQPLAAARAARKAYAKVAGRQAEVNAKKGRNGRRLGWSSSGISHRIGNGMRLAGIGAKVACRVWLAKHLGRVKRAVRSGLRRVGRRIGKWTIDALGQRQQEMSIGRRIALTLTALLVAWPIARLLTGEPVRQTVTPADVHAPVADSVDSPGTVAQEGQAMAAESTRAVLGQMLLSKAEEMSQAAAGYTPNGMIQWVEDMGQLGDALREIARAVASIQAGADGLPLHPAVKDSIGAVVAVLHSAGGAADQIRSTVEATHRIELERLRNGRPNEHLWDVRANQ